MTLVSINPATDEIIRHYDELPQAQVVDRIGDGHAAFMQWRQSGFDHRAAALRRLAAALKNDRDAYARLMAVEMGKPLKDGLAEVDKCAWVCDYYAEHGAAMLAHEHVRTEAVRSYVAFEPLGLILAVMPWNFPFWQVFRFAAPTLMAGNAVVLKHASNVSGCALAIEDLFRQTGFPLHLFQSLLLSSERVAEVIANPLVRGVSLTGSTEAGRSIAGAAGRHLKKVVLELGGSDPYIILEDADLDAAAEACAHSRLLNSGQSCIAAKRFIVVDAVRAHFEERLRAALQKRKMGDPLDARVDLGPQARRDLRDNLHRQVQVSIDRGARLLLGGTLPDGPGAFYPATLLTGVEKGMPAHDEEIFGPVAAVIAAADEREAIARANDSLYGLGAAVFSRDIRRAERIAREEIEAGACFVNTYVRSDPRLPFGGVRDSGLGRELGHYGLKEFTNIKTVWVA